MPGQKLGASFRDPSGYIFRDERGTLLRYVSRAYQKEYDQLASSGLYDALTKDKLLIPHEDITSRGKIDADGYKLIKPELIPFISYPYEWSFSQLKDAALTTLRIQKMALAHGLVLKDASAYNIQFSGSRPTLIDTLSFDIYKEGEPWIAYRQFCQHFLAPLALASYVDIRLLNLLRDYIDGIPLDLASTLLPVKTRFRPQLSLHLHLHARSQKKHAGSTKKVKATLSRRSLNSLVESLEMVIKSLRWKPAGTEWGDYYSFTNYSSSAFKSKAEVVKKLLAQTQSQMVWDLGANIGEFSRLAAEQGSFTVAFDVDPAAVEKGYQLVKKNHETNLLPLVLDLTNPSASIGWANRERSSLQERGPADTIMALALIHHLAISNNVPLSEVAAYFARLAKYLIIEFVPKEDSQVQKLLANRKDIFPNYDQAGFEKAFSEHFQIVDKPKVVGSKRTLYLLKAR